MGAIAKYYRKPTAPDRPTDTKNEKGEAVLIEQFKRGLELAEKSIFIYRNHKLKHNGNIRLALARSVIQETKPPTADAQTWDRDRERLENLCKADGADWGEEDLDALARMFVGLGGYEGMYEKNRSYGNAP